MDLNLTLFQNVFSFNDPNDALPHGMDLFLTVVNNHAPLRKKRVKG